MRVAGPEDLSRVVFLLDGESIGEDSVDPFRWQFRTADYATGLHTLSAKGFSASGREYESNKLQREFLSSDQSGIMTALLVSSLLVLVVGGRWLTSRIANRGQEKGATAATSGPLGGTICPNCDRPYALHLWGVNLMFARLDKCPHCGKWRLVSRASQQALDAAIQAAGGQDGDSGTTKGSSDEELMRRKLDDSRFQDSP
jgi:hypothetical protein